MECSLEEGKCVLDKYKSLIDNGSKTFLFGRNVFQKLSSVKISFLAMAMANVDFL